MKNKSIKSIQDELTNIVTNFYRDAPIQDLNTIMRYKMINETTSYLFETYRNDFYPLVQQQFQNKLNEEELRIEGLLLTSWVTVCVLKNLQTIRAPYNHIREHVINN